jgi:hypothetical protein
MGRASSTILAVVVMPRSASSFCALALPRDSLPFSPIKQNRRGFSDDSNVRKAHAGLIDGLGNDFSPVGIVVLIAYKGDDLSAALLCVQNQPEDGSFLMRTTDKAPRVRGEASVIGVFSKSLPFPSAKNLPPVATSALEKGLDDSGLVVALVSRVASPASQFVAAFSA